MVVTVLIPVRASFHLEPYIRKERFDNMGKLILLTSSIVGYSYGMEYFMAWYSANPYEQLSFWGRGFVYHSTSTWIMISCNVLSPCPLVKWCRTNVMWRGHFDSSTSACVERCCDHHDRSRTRRPCGSLLRRVPQQTDPNASFALFGTMFTIFLRSRP